MRKIWYMVPGKPAIQGTMSATLERYAESEIVVIQIPDPYDPGEVRIAVPRQLVFTEEPRPEAVIDRAWHEVFTSKGYRYGGEEEANAKAWFKEGFNYRGKL